MRAAALIPAGFLIGAACCRHLLGGHPANVAADLAQPLAVVTYWKAFGAWIFAALLLAIAIAFCGYGAALRGIVARQNSDPKRTLAAIVLFGALACATALLWPVIFSSDVYAYAAYGDLALRGLSPYAHVPPHLHDPLLDAAAWQWRGGLPMCVYGPAFVWIAKTVVASTQPFGTAAALWMLRSLSCVLLLCCAPLAYFAFARFPQNVRLTAAAGIALNPTAIWESASGHNDALAVAAVLAGFAVIQSRHLRTGAAIVALGSLVKAPAAAACAAVVISAWRDRDRFTTLLAASTIAIGVAALAAAPLESALVSHALSAGTYRPQFSLQYALRSIVPLCLAAGIVGFVSLALAAAGIRRLADRQIDGAIFLAFAAWIAIPNPYPWYALWILPCAFGTWNTRAAQAIVCASLLIVLRYLPDATWAAFPPETGTALTLLEFAVPLLLFSAYIRDQLRPNRRENHRPALDFAQPHFE